MVPVKFDRKAILKAAKAKNRPDKANYTFRFNSELMKTFKEHCEKEGVTATSVLEEFLREFTKK
jgi:hypothetical protein